MGNAVIKGFLYDLGGYPGAIYDPENGEKIFGELYHI